MWEAAISGVSALGVYLLAYLLARAWGSTGVTLIWRELEIGEGFGEHHAVSEPSLFSVRQNVERVELGLWDSSARSWLHSKLRSQ